MSHHCAKTVRPPRGSGAAHSGFPLARSSGAAGARQSTATGIPHQVQTGLEALSGIDLSGVRVHRNSAEPAHLNALAYTQGQDIYVGPRQERHLPHEGWHVVQQMQGRVQPTVLSKGRSPGTLINNDAGLEREADVMGAKALQLKPAERASTASARVASPPVQPMVQRTIGDGHDLSLQGPPTASPIPLSVDRIDIVDSAAGAIGGYPPIVGGADLNTPGPFNDPVTGETKNAHQIHFHLDNGNSAALLPRRELQRTAIIRGTSHDNPPDQVLPPGVAGPPVPGGFTGLRVGPDGPPPHEVQRPTADTIAIADAPGINNAPAAADYPISYMSHFFLTVEDPRGAPIARINYDVRIRQTGLVNIPNAENQIVATEKKDFVRGRNL